MSETKERPIVFTGESVRAILAGRKTQTRRVVKPQPVLKPTRSIIIGQELPYTHTYHWDPTVHDHSLFTEAEKFGGGSFGAWRLSMCPFGKPGSRLWVRESFITGWDAESGDILYYDKDGNDLPEKTWFRADVNENLVWIEDGVTLERIPWKSSMFMPRVVARILLEVISVRVERLQEISASGCVAEGLEGRGMNPYVADCLRKGYAELWDSINGKREGCSWADNPWIWRVEFKRVEQEAKP